MISIIVRIILGSLIGAVLANMISEAVLDDRYIDIDLADYRRQNLAYASLYSTTPIEELQRFAGRLYWSVEFTEELPECFYPIDLSVYEMAGLERQSRMPAQISGPLKDRMLTEQEKENTQSALIASQFADRRFYENRWPFLNEEDADCIFEREDMMEYDDEMEYGDEMDSDDEMELEGTVSFEQDEGFEGAAGLADHLGMDDGLGFEDDGDLEDGLYFEDEMALEDDFFEYRQAISVPGGYLILGPDSGRLYDNRSSQALDELDFYITALSFGCMLLVNALLLTGWTRGVGRLQKLTAAFARGDFAHRIEERGPEPLRVLISNLHQMAWQLEQAENQQQVMMNALPHELRTPLARIRMACDMLQAQPEQQEKWLGRAQQYLDDMEHLVQALLRLNRVASQPMTPDDEPVEIKQLVVDLVEQESQIDPRVQCKFIDDSIAQLPVIGDRELLAVVISNLIMNACRYSQTEIMVSVEQIANRVVLRITDDGKGFPEKELEHLLQPFNRGDESRSRQSGGFGLGLAIVDVIIRAHQGGVELSNLPEGGACVQFWLPLAD